MKVTGHSIYYTILQELNSFFFFVICNNCDVKNNIGLKLEITITSIFICLSKVKITYFSLS